MRYAQATPTAVSCQLRIKLKAWGKAYQFCDTGFGFWPRCANDAGM
ncbi:MAG: hypothetical protein F6K63_24360 [Moorea sp. SIO1G6]|nr:hypothetical protein [Moorena sp. SIO1G6]